MEGEEGWEEEGGKVGEEGEGGISPPRSFLKVGAYGRRNYIANVLQGKVAAVIR